MGAFSGFNDNKSNQKKHKTPTVNAHYTKLARRTSLFKLVCIIFIVFSAIYCLTFHPNEITMENFRYMLKFINLGTETTPQVDILAFDGNDGNMGVSYKGDLAVLNESGLTITDWKGQVTLREGFSFAHPKINQNGVNLFCYDLGGKEVKIFNSHSLLSEISLDYPLYWFASSESGNFAIATSAKGYRSAVNIYDKQFILIYSSFFGDKYVDFVDISPDGKEFITASHFSQSGNIVTQISKFRTDTENVIVEHKFIGEIPLGIYYTENGYCLLTSDKMRMFDNNDAQTGEISFSGRELLSCRVFGNKVIVTYALEGLSGGTETIIYGLDGVSQFSNRFGNSVNDAKIIGDVAYILTPGELTLSDVASGQSETYIVPTSYSSLTYNGEKIILFSESQAEFFDKSKFELKEAN